MTKWYSWREMKSVGAKAVICLAFISAVWSANVVKVPGQARARVQRPGREHSGSRGKGTPSSHQGCRIRWEADNPHFQIGSVTYTTSNTPIGRQTGGGRDEGLT